MKNIFKKFCVLIASVLLLSNVNALSITKSGDEVVQTGEYDSVRFVAGNNVTNTAKIDGISFAAGNELYLKGNVKYGFYAGSKVVVDETVEHDLFAAGRNIIINQDAVLNRDVFLAGQSIIINSNIKRDLRVAGEVVVLKGIKIDGDAHIYADKIELDENTIITGKLVYPQNAKVVGIKNENVGSVEIEPVKEPVKVSFMDRVLSFVISVLSGFITLLVLFKLLAKSNDKLNKTSLKASDILKRCAIGFAVLVLVPILCLFALFTGILTPLSLIFIAVYIICLYLSSLIVSYIVGKNLMKKAFKKDNLYLSILCGLVIVKLIKLLPYFGGLIGFVILIYGLGLIFMYVKPEK